MDSHTRIHANQVFDLCRRQIESIMTYRVFLYFELFDTLVKRHHHSTGFWFYLPWLSRRYPTPEGVINYAESWSASDNPRFWNWGIEMTCRDLLRVAELSLSDPRNDHTVVVDADSARHLQFNVTMSQITAARLSMCERSYPEYAMAFRQEVRK